MELSETVLTQRGFEVKGASPELLQSLLEAYEVELVDRSPRMKESFLPGLSRAEIEDRFAAEDLKAPEEAIVWWQWHNGVRAGLGGATPRIAPMPLDEALTLRREDSESSMPQWGPGWIRLYGGGQKYSVAMDCSKESTPRIAFFEVEAVEFIQQQRTHVFSLCTPATWWLLALKNGWNRWDESGLRWRNDRQQYPYEWRLTELI